MKYVAVMGHGTVGSGVCEVLLENESQITKGLGEPLQLKYVLDLHDFDHLPYADKFIHDFSILENDPDVSVVAEVMGGVGAALEFTRRLLKAGKSVCTSNKELVATHGAELLALAKEHGVSYLFEASVGGGIPLIRPMMHCLAGNRIDSICGILNGTTNYILTKMIAEGLSFSHALAKAQEHGYAEKDPTADVEGHDACRKICILSDIAFGDAFDPDAVSCEGITGITLEEADAAKELGFAIKLIGRASRTEEGKVFAFVAPHLVPHAHMLASVDGVFNAVMVHGNAVGDVLFYGKGAGKRATASAVVADLMDAAFHQPLPRNLVWGDGSQNLLLPLDVFASPWFVHIEGDKAQAESLLPVCHSISSGTHHFLITETMTTAQMDEVKAKLGTSVQSTLRVLEGGV